MNISGTGPKQPLSSQPSRDAVPRRLIVTVSVVAFAISDWSLWVLLREGPWGPPMRLVLGNEAVLDSVERTLEALLLWPRSAPLVQLKAGWQEQKVHVWGSNEQGAAVSLIHSILLRANRDQLRPNLHKQPIPSLHVGWVPVEDVEAGRRELDPDMKPVLSAALHTLRSYIVREPELILRYLADMGKMGTMAKEEGSWRTGKQVNGTNRETLPLNVIKEPETGDGILTLAEANLLYRAFFPPDEQVDLSNLRRRFLATNRLEPVDEERHVRGREMEWRRVSRAYRYTGDTGIPDKV
ncbi:hypothetical protein EI42_02511 [Thermosporothrix hazakensis]|uniref:Uncharacterized protein n=2 Tax=Thermosporothrix TaxID=768650 RepID=A0A326UGM6_THEHA|nr:hypothetical protein [Thermosporothrix hazakensis]PZW30540.1 hypothetical protein EI42_02511 [Thermosporothrix hazakensis]BBH91255.1 hypothetical protein KTC_60060 [Thermosporothrix sp. COM3]GCE49401.1 hypothetical protein KTH_42700 [Thermosporothrix hazakensis]